MTNYVEELEVEALIAAPGCPETLVRRMLRQSAVDFYRETKAWRVTTDVAPVIKGDREVELDIPANTQLVMLYWAKLADDALDLISSQQLSPREGRPTALAVDGLAKTVLLDVIPRDSYLRNGLVARVALAPTVELDDLPAELYSAHRDGILYGAITRLLAMPNVAWGNLQDAQTYAGMAANVKYSAKREAESLQAPVVRKVRYGGI